MMQHIQLVHLRFRQNVLHHSHGTHLEAIVVSVTRLISLLLTMCERQGEGSLPASVKSLRIVALVFAQHLFVAEHTQRASPHALLGVRETEPEPGVLLNVQRGLHVRLFSLLSHASHNQVVCVDGCFDSTSIHSLNRKHGKRTLATGERLHTHPAEHRVSALWPPARDGGAQSGRRLIPGEERWRSVGRLGDAKQCAEIVSRAEHAAYEINGKDLPGL